MKSVSTFNIKVPWGHIAAKAWGNSKNTKILVVHGTLDNAGSFDRLILLLPENFYYVCIDLPGHGFSSHFENGTALDFFNYVLAIKYVLDELKWDTTYYIGHSLGAQLGFFFTLIYPNRIQKLILIDSIIPKECTKDKIIPKITNQFDLAIETYRPKNVNYYTKKEVMYALQYLRNCCLTLEAAEALFERSVTKIDTDSYIYNRDIRQRNLILPLLNFDELKYLITQIKVDTLLIMVTDTIDYQKLTLSSIQNILKNYKNIKILRFRGNHDIHNNYPEKISEYISNFLTYTSSKL